MDLAPPPGAPLALEQARIVDVFIAACLRGEAKLKPEQSISVTLEHLPKQLRREYRPAGGTFVKLAGSASSFLYWFDQSPHPRRFARVCGIASQIVDIGFAWRRISLEIDRVSYEGPAAEHVGNPTQLMFERPEHGYTLSYASGVGGYSVVQIGWMTEQQRESSLIRRRRVDKLIENKKKK